MSHWTKYKFDVYNRGRTTDVGPVAPIMLDWRYGTGGEIVAAPILVSGRPLFGSKDSYFYSIQTWGELFWRYLTDGQIRSHAGYYSGALLVGSDDLYLYNLKLDSGGYYWRSSMWWTNGLAAHKFNGYYGYGYGDSLGIIDGNGNWIRSYDTDGSVETALACDSSSYNCNIYIGSNDGYLYKLTTSLALKWKYNAGSPVIASPMVDTSGNVYFGTLDGYLYSLSSAGALNWRYLTGGAIYSSPSVDSAGNIYFGSYDGYLYKLDPSGNLVWRYLTGGAIHSSPAIDGNDNIYFGSTDGVIYSLSPASALNWSYATGGAIYSSPAITNEMIVGSRLAIGSNDGYMYYLKTNPAPPISSAVCQATNILIDAKNKKMINFIISTS